MKHVCICDDLFRAGRDMKIKEEFERKELKMTEIGNQTNDWELTTDEAGRLEELETVIAENFQGFYAVGCALAEINSSRLYRQTYVTFEDYCRERFEIARRTAYQYIEAKEVMDNVRHGAQTKLLPLNERQVRPLTRLEPDAQAKAWEKIVKSAPFDGGITAKHVSEVVCEILGKQIQKKADGIKAKTRTDLVSKEFTDALWALIEVVRAEVAKPLKAKMRENMRDSIRRVENLLAD